MQNVFIIAKISKKKEWAWYAVMLDKHTVKWVPFYSKHKIIIYSFESEHIQSWRHQCVNLRNSCLWYFLFGLLFYILVYVSFFRYFVRYKIHNKYYDFFRGITRNLDFICFINSKTPCVMSSALLQFSKRRSDNEMSSTLRI